MNDEQLKANSEPGRAILICVDCQRETGPHTGVLSLEELPELGSIFYPDERYVCTECDGEQFGWTWFDSSLYDEDTKKQT